MPELNSDIYDLTQNLQGAIYRGAYTALGDNAPPMLSQKYPMLQVRAGYAESCGWMLVQVAEFDPEPLTVERFRTRAVYSSPRIAQAMLELLASEGWLDRVGDAYTFTDDGRAVMQEIIDWRIIVLKDFVPIDVQDIQRLNDLQNRVLDACMQAGDPPGTWCLAHSRHRVIADAPVMYRLLHHGTDFNAFRDDAHMAAYNEHGVIGRTWEALAHVVDEKATTADQLFAQLGHRGFARGEWAASLADLVAREWVTAQDNGQHSVTDAGQSVRTETEQRTDDYFFKVWRQSLSQEELDELCVLMGRLHDAAIAIVNG